MGHVDGRLNFDTKIDTKGFSKGLGTLKGQMNGLASLAGKLAGLLAAVFSGKEMIETAAEVKALNSQFEQTFGVMQKSAQNAIDNVASTSHILETRLKGTASKIYSFAKTSGMDSASALNLMSDALQVTADSAAYYDRSLEDTAETLQSFLKGNYANDAALGLSATETTRNAAALKLYGKSFQDLSEAQKQVALLEMVKDANRLSGAMGQAAREADGWENVTGNLKEAWKQLLAAIGQPVLALAVPIVQRLTGALQMLTSIAQRAAQALSSVFGITLETEDSSNSLADNADSAAQSYSDMAEAAQEAQEANENSLASFDQITKLSDKSDSGSSSSGSGTSTNSSDSIVAVGNQADAVLTEVDSKFEAFFRRVKEKMERLFEPLRSSWSRYGDSILGHASDIIDIVIGHLGDIGNSVIDWASGLNLDPLFSSFDRLLEAVAPFADDIGAGLKWFFDNVLLPLGSWTIEDLIPTFLTALGDALDGARSAWETAAPVIKEELWDKFLKPIAKWTGNKIVKLIESLGSGIKKLGESITEKDVKVLLDLAEAIGAIFLAVKGAGLISSFSSSLTGFVTKAKTLITTAGAGIGTAGGASIGSALGVALITAIASIGIGTAIRDAIGGDRVDRWFDDFMEGCQLIGSTVANFFTETIPNAVTGAIDKLLELNDRLWSTIFSAIDSAISFFTETIPAFFSSMCEDIVLAVTGFADTVKQTAVNAWDGIKNAFSSVGTWFRTKFTDAWTNIKEIFSLENIKTHFDNVLIKIKTVFSSIGTWFKTKFQNAWDKIKEVFSIDNVKEHFDLVVAKIGDVFGGLANILKSPINAVIDLVNTAIDKINGISVDIPDWVPEIGGGRLGFNIPKIPRLARGTVVPAGYGEFLAVLGDNKREAEVVSPISAIKQAVMEAMVELGSVGGNGSKQPMTVYVQVDRKTIGQVVIDDINDKTRRNGRSPLENPASST